MNRGAFAGDGFEEFHVIPDEASLYRRYLDSLGRITNLVLEDFEEENWKEILHLMAEAARVSICTLHLNEGDGHGRLTARLRAVWSPHADLSIPPALTHLAYEDFALLNDTLHIGMVLTKDLAELPPQEFALFKHAHISSVLCIPLLVNGEMAGFLGFYCQREKNEWLPMEIDILCVAANNFSAALSRQQIENSLRASESRLRVLVGATEDIVIEFNHSGLVQNFWSDHSLLPPSSSAGLHLTAALPQGMARALLDAVPLVMESGKSETVEFSLEDALGDQYFTGRLQTVPAEDGRNTHLVALIRDVTDQIQAEARRQTMLDTLDLLEEAIIDMTPQGRLTDASAGWVKLRGERGAGRTLPDQSLLQLVHPDDENAVLTALGDLEVGKAQTATLRFRLSGKNQEYLWVEARLFAHRTPQGHVACMRGILRDITASYLEQKRITQLALHDSLTQLPNRILLHDHLQKAITRAQRNGTKVALGFIDLDHFKQINDNLGHHAGDTVLLTLSKRLLGVMREVDTLCRWGGDEFVALLPDTLQQEDARLVARRLMEAGRQPIQFEEQQVLPTLSIGFAVYPDDADSVESLMALADQTMFHAKRNGRNNVQFYRDLDSGSAQLELLDHLVQLRGEAC